MCIYVQDNLCTCTMYQVTVRVQVVHTAVPGRVLCLHMIITVVNDHSVNS